MMKKLEVSCNIVLDVNLPGYLYGPLQPLKLSCPLFNKQSGREAYNEWSCAGHFVSVCQTGSILRETWPTKPDTQGWRLGKN